MYDFFRAIGHFVVNPINQLVIMIITLVFLTYLRSRKARWVAVTILLHILFFGSQIGLYVTMKPLESSLDLPRNEESLDAVVILTGGTLQFDPVLSLYEWGNSAARYLEAFRLFKASRSKFLVISGATPGYSGPLLSEADSMFRLAKEWGIPEEQIVVERRSQSTEFHPIELRPIFLEKNINNFYLVTSASHMLRATKVFEKYGLHPVPYPVNRYYAYTDRFFDPEYYFAQKLALDEWVGLLIYALRGKI